MKMHLDSSLEAYKTTLPQLDGYLNDCGKINLKRCTLKFQNVVELKRQVLKLMN